MISLEYYRRNLPHIQPFGGIFFVTYNLAGSIPKEVYKRLKENYESEKYKLLKISAPPSFYSQLRKKYFSQQDKILNRGEKGPHYLKDDRIALVTANSLFHWDNKKLELICYCIMSNHVHTIIRLFDKNEIENPSPLHKIMQSIKRFSAKEANEILGKKGQFWQNESFDYLIRDRNELYRIIEYILDNPVKAGLCKNRKDWKWSYIKEEYNEFM